MKTQPWIKLSDRATRGLIASLHLILALCVGGLATAFAGPQPSKQYKAEPRAIAPLVYTPATPTYSASAYAAQAVVNSVSTAASNVTTANTAPVRQDFETLAERFENNAYMLQLYVMLFPEMSPALRAEYQKKAETWLQAADQTRGYARSLPN